jgi:alpha-tubulin suppressor-like RCC1 family protein
MTNTTSSSSGESCRRSAGHTNLPTIILRFGTSSWRLEFYWLLSLYCWFGYCSFEAQAQLPTGTVLGWGNSPGVPSGVSNVSTIAVGNGGNNLILNNDGTIISWGSTGLPGGLSNVTAVASGQDWSAAVLTNGTVIGSGAVPADLTNVTTVSINADNCLALKRDGTVEPWGVGFNGTYYVYPIPPPGLSNVVAISAGMAHGVALQSDGTVVVWGDNAYGQTNLPANLTNVVALAAGQYHTVALNADGSLTVWGNAPPPPVETNAVAVASSVYSYILLTGDGAVSGYGVNANVPPGLTGARVVAAGGFSGGAVIETNDFAFASRQNVGSSVFDGSTFFIQSAIADFPISTYQWQFNGTNIAGATNRLLTLANLPLTATGNYSVVVSNLYGVFLSSNVWLQVTSATPFIVTAPVGQTVVPGTNTMLGVIGGGSLPIYYQWQFNGTNIAGATSSVLQFASVAPTNRGYYDVVLSNAYGTFVSSNVYLHVLDAGDALNATNLVWSTAGDAPWFVENQAGYNFTHDGLAMQSGAITSGQRSTIQTTVAGPGTLTYWWNVSSWPAANYLDFSVSGLNQARISCTDTYFSYGWEIRTNYLGTGSQVLTWAFVKNDSRGSASGGDSGWLDQVSYAPGGTAPYVSLSPTNQVILLGSNATLNAAGLGTPPLNYQWQFNLANIDGATSPTLLLTNLQFTGAGNYALVISNSFGVTTSTPAFMNVVDFAGAANATNLVWSTGGNQSWFAETTVSHDGVAALQSGPITGGQQSTLQTTVTGPGTLSFWWQVSSYATNNYANFTLDGSEQARITGGVNWRQQTYYLTPGTHTLSWAYTKTSFAVWGSDTAWVDQVSYVPGATAAYVTVNPTNQTVALGANAVFSVTAAGTPAITYQWLLGGMAIPDATNATLVVSNVQLASTGVYVAAVTNGYGGSVSSNASLNLLSVYAWGAGKTNTITSPNYGQCIVPANLSAVTAIAAGGYHSLALRSNGTVVAWGYNSSNQTNVPSTLTNATAVAAGLFISMALRSNGTVAVWGNSLYSQTTVPASASNVAAIASGWYHCLALRSNGTVVAWGAGTSQALPPNYGQSSVPNNLTNVTAIAAGAYHSLALRTNGTVVAWGSNAFGQTNVPLGLSNVIAIAAGGSNSVALKSDGTLVAWGANGNGQTNIPYGLTNVVAISCGAAHNMALRNDGRLVVWGLNGNGQTNVPVVLTNIMAISAGAYHSMALINVGPVKFLSQPMKLITYTASTIELNSSALGAPPLNYQWQFNGTNIDGATNAWLILTNLPFSAAGNYWCIASNSYGVATNLIGTLTVLRSTPSFNPAALNLTGAGFGWELDSLSGHGMIVIYASSNLANWTPVLTNPPQVGTLKLIDPNATNLPAGFYRAQEF